MQLKKSFDPIVSTRLEEAPKTSFCFGPSQTSTFLGGGESKDDSMMSKQVLFEH